MKDFIRESDADLLMVLGMIAGLVVAALLWTLFVSWAAWGAAGVIGWLIIVTLIFGPGALAIHLRNVWSRE